MAVPDNNTFPLSVVVAEIGASSPTLGTCFAEASAGGFDPAYEGNKDRLSNFRAYDNNPIVDFTWNFITNEAINNTRWNTDGVIADFDPDGALNISSPIAQQGWFTILTYIGQVGFPLPVGFPDGNAIYKLEFTVRGGGDATGEISIRSGFITNRVEELQEAIYENGALTNSVPMAFNGGMLLTGAVAPFDIRIQNFDGDLIIEEIRIVGVTSGFVLDNVFNIPGNLQGWTLGANMVQNANGSLRLNAFTGTNTSLIGITTNVPEVGNGTYSWSVLFSEYNFVTTRALYRRLGNANGEPQYVLRMNVPTYDTGQRMYSFKNIRTPLSDDNQSLILRKTEASPDTATIVRTQIYSGL